MAKFAKKEKVKSTKNPSLSKSKLKTATDSKLKNAKQIETPKQKKTSHLKIKSVSIKEKDKVLGTRRVKRDFIERKRAEIILRDEKKRMRTILDLVGDPIFVKDNDHRITLANRAFFDMFCMDENSVIGNTLAEAVPENERQHFLEVDRRVLDTGIPDQREEELTVKTSHVPSSQGRRASSMNPGKTNLSLVHKMGGRSCIFTNYPYSQYKEKCIEEGADYFFDKNINFQEIKKLIVQLAQNVEGGNDG